MKYKENLKIIILALLIVLGTTAFAEALECKRRGFTKDFMIDQCTFSNIGSNPFFILEPGFQLVLEGKEEGEDVRLEITVLDETETVNGVVTRVVEEIETKGGELVEVSRNFFAICNETNSVFYHGETTDIYEDGEIVSHEGAWRAGEDGAEPGIIMPGTILKGARYFQEMAPEVAMDRAEIICLDAVLETPYDTFENCLKTEETTPLEPGAKDFKFYAFGIGLIKDGTLLLTGVTFPPQ